MIKVKRTRGIQDKMEHLWDHLAPECYDQLYDCLQVDVWSIGNLLVFLLTQNTPFTSPVTVEQAAVQWTKFKKSHPSVFNSQMTPVTAILDLIFVHLEKRIKVTQLVEKFGPQLDMGNLGMRRRSSDTTRARRVKSADATTTGGKQNRSITKSSQSGTSAKSSSKDNSKRRDSSGHKD